MTLKLTTTVVILLSSLAACSERGEASTRRDKVVDSSAGTVALGIGGVEYSAASVASAGSIAGTITVQGQPTPDSVVAVARDAKLCGDKIGRASCRERV